MSRRMTGAVSLGDNMGDSAFEMQRTVWPRWTKYVDGTLAPAELAGGAIAELLDTSGGIDYFNFSSKRGLVPIASRVEWRSEPISNFTIRFRLPSGKPTEFEKLDRGITNQIGVTPHAHVHSFCRGQRRQSALLASAIARTADIVAYLKNGLYAHERPEQWKEAWRENRDDGVVFLAAGYQGLIKAGYPLVVLTPEPNNNAAPPLCLFDDMWKPYQELKEYNGGFAAIWSKK
jgi:hypothetical protein